MDRIFLRPHSRFRNDWNQELALDKRQDSPEAYICFRLAGHRLLKPDFMENPVKHVKDFVMLFCSTPGCMNSCQVEGAVASGATFTCRGCNKSTAKRFGIQPHQFDKSLGGHAPEGFRTPGAYGANTSKRNAKRDLRKFLDGNDPMVADGHQINKDRTVDRECPEWICNRFEFLNFLIGVFPKMLDEASPRYRQPREKAALWGGVMYYYHRMGLPASHVAKLLCFEKVREHADGPFEVLGERKVTGAQVERIVNAIKKRHAGLRVDGSKLTGKRGRPIKKKFDVTDVDKMIELFETDGVSR